MSVSEISGDTLELTDIHEDTAIFGGLTEDLMRRISQQDNPNTGPATMVRHLKIDGFGALREPPWKESRNIDLFFHALVLTPLESITLENIGMFPYDERSGTFPIRLLTRLLQASGTAPSSLRTLELRDVILEGIADEWEAFAETLGTLKNLQLFVLETCDCAIEFPSEQFTSFNQVLQQLLRGPLQAQTLQQLTLVPAQNYGGDLESTTIESILRQSSSLREMKISNIGRLNDDMMTTIFTSLTPRDREDETTRSAATSLEILHLKNCEMNPSALAALLEFLGSQQQSLKMIHIGLASPPNRGDSQFIHEETPVIELFTALKLNRTLDKFVLSSDGTPQRMSQKATHAYLEMMQLNCSLLDMFVTYPNLHFHPNIMGFYAKLNLVGRRKFLQDSHLVTREEWVDMLGRVADDESCLFYFLRLNPLLCQCFV